MNHVYRVTWNEVLNTWVAVPEVARRKGKSSRAGKAAAAIALGVLSGLAQAQFKPATTVVPASGKTNAYVSPNGVPVVNIETANAAGVSHNKYTNYNVEANGLVLNNGNMDQVARQSQLAGQVMANTNLIQQATIIINEVVSTNRSVLGGFTEVLGGKADVIVANPNGITCSGCGFINTDRVTLTTGTPNLAGNGALSGFTVNQGDVLINGSGANLSTQQIFDIVARSVRIDGTVNGPDVSITAGANTWRYDSRSVTGSATATGTAPTLAIDSSALGGMYINRIRLVATEAGVGVRMLGEVATSVDDFTLTAAGKVEIQSHVSAARDLSITSTSATGTEDIHLSGADASLSASRNLDITTSAGQLKLTEGTLYGGNNLGVTAASLIDASTNQTRVAEVDSSITVSGSTSVDGSRWSANTGSLTLGLGSLSIGSSGATLDAHDDLSVTTSTGNMSLGAAALVAQHGDMSLTATSGQISTTAGADQGILVSVGDLSMTAATGLSNAGVIAVDTGTLTMRLSGTVTNSGTIYSATSIDLADKNNLATQTLSNSGTILADTTLAIKANAFTNTADIQGTTDTTVAATSLTNSGTFIASGTPGSSGTFTLASLSNTGTLQSAEDLTIHASGTLSNTGVLLADHDLSILAGSSSLAITNSSTGYIQAANLLTITGSNATFNTQAGKVLSDSAALTLSGLNNSGTIQTDTTLGFTVGNGLTNSGTLLAMSAMTGSAASLTNSGTIQADTGATLTVSGAMTNTGTVIASDDVTQSGTLNLGTLSNTGAGVIQSAYHLNLNLSGATLTNSGKILADNDLSITSTGSGLTLTNQAGGYLQAGNSTGDDLTVGGTAVTFNNNASAYALGNTLALTLSALTNAGTAQSETTTSYTISGGLTNSGTLLAKTSMSGTSDSLTNSGTLQANQGATLTATGAITNTGTLVASNGASYSGTLTSATLSNTGSGVIQSAHNLSINLSGANLINAAKILADDDLTITSTGSGLTVTNQAGGYMQAGSGTGDDLTIGGTAVTLNNNASAYLIGDRLALTASGINNAGTMQGGTGASTFTVTNTLLNTGTLNLSSTSGGSGTITADTISNTGTLQSQGDASFNLATQFASSGNTLIAGDLTMRGTDSAYTISDTGRIQSGGLMDLKGQNGGTGVDITVGSSGVLLGDSMALNAGTLTVNNGGMVSTSGDLTATLATLSFGGSTSRIVAATSGTGTASITLSNAYTNVGAVHSGDVLNFSAPSITNSTTGGFSALDTLTVTSSAGNFTNSGALYAGSQLNATASGTFTNTATLSAPQGTMDSGGNISVTANTFINNSNINATGNITISAATFRNETPGGDTRAWHEVSNSGSVHDSTNSWYSFPDDYETQYWHVSWRKEQYYTGGTPAFKPQLIGGGTVTIQNFNTGTNIGAIISGGTVNLSGAGGATFTNNDLSLGFENWKRTWEIYTHWIALGPATYDDHVLRNVSADFTESTGTISSIGAGIFASTLNASGFSLVNAGSPHGVNTNSTSASGTSNSSLGSSASGTTGGSTTSGTSGTSGNAGVGGVTGANGAPGVSFGGLVITLPTNPNGYFVTSQDPNAHFLVETNPLFNVGSNFVGSDYLAKRYGYNPDTVQKRLGDANYEAYLIRQQLVAQTNKNILKGYADEAAQMKRLMDQAFDQSKSLGLSFGKAPTPSQLANLKQDMVWMVETVVAGQKVLTPVVYLTAATKAGIETGAVIAANDVNLNLDSLTNTGGTIRGDDTLNITAKGDIRNTSGTIKGGDVSVTSTSGSIINETYVKGDGNDKEYNTTIGKTASIESTRTLSLDAAKNITVKGADVKAGTDATLKAGENVTFDTIVNKTAKTTHESTDMGLLYSSREDKTVTTEKNIGSNLTAGGNLKISSGKDTTIAGSKVKAGGDLDIDAQGSVNILARQDKTTTKVDSEKSGIGVGGGWYGSEKTTSENFKGKNMGSTIESGGNMSLNAKDNIVVQGSKIDTKGDLDMKGKDILVLAGKDEERTKTTTKTTTIGGYTEAGDKGEKGDGADFGKSGKGGVGIKVTDTDLETNSYKSTAQVSSIKAGGNVSRTASGTLLDQGTNIEAGGDLTDKAKNIRFDQAENVDITTTKKTVNTTKVGVDVNLAYGDTYEAGKKGDLVSLLNPSMPEAGVSVSHNNTQTNTSSEKRTGVAGSIKTGGNVKRDATESNVMVGTNVDAGGDITLTGKKVDLQAARDYEKTTSSEQTVDAKVRAAMDITRNVNVSAEAGYGKESQTDESSTAKVGSLNAGGKIKIQAEETARLEGTKVKGTGGVEIEGADVKIEAAKSTYSGSSSSMNASGGVSMSRGKGGDDKGGGISGAYGNESSSFKGSNAEAASIEGGNVSLNAKKGSLTLEGTKIDAGSGSVQLAAKDKVDFQAATSTYESSSDRFGVGGGISGSAGKQQRTGDSQKNLGVSAQVGVGSSSEQIVNKQGGSIKGNNLSITSGGDTRLEGTNITTKNAELDVGGKLVMESAQSTRTKRSSDVDVGVSGSGGNTKSGDTGKSTRSGTTIAANVGVGSSSADQLTNQNAQLTGDNVKIKVKGDATLSGANVDAKKLGMNVGGNLKVESRADIDKSSDTNVKVQAVAYVPAGSKKDKPGDTDAKKNDAGNKKPADDKKPAPKDKRPADDKKSDAKDKKPADDKKSDAKDKKPADDKKSDAKDKKPADDKKSDAKDKKPADDKKSDAKDKKPADDKKSDAKDKKPADDKKSDAKDKKPADDKKSDEAKSDSKDDKPAEEKKDLSDKIKDAKGSIKNKFNDAVDNLVGKITHTLGKGGAEEKADLAAAKAEAVAREKGMSKEDAKAAGQAKKKEMMDAFKEKAYDRDETAATGIVKSGVDVDVNVSKKDKENIKKKSGINASDSGSTIHVEGKTTVDTADLKNAGTTTSKQGTETLNTVKEKNEEENTRVRAPVGVNQAAGYVGNKVGGSDTSLKGPEPIKGGDAGKQLGNAEKQRATSDVGTADNK